MARPGAGKAGFGGDTIPGALFARETDRVAYRDPEDRKEEVRRATDVVALVQRYVPLRRSGRSFSACCPFHQERTPSFHVWPESQRWKCFSCNRSGDAFSFVMEKEGVEFPEALRMLARDAGIELERRDPATADASRAMERAKDAAYEACEWACRWFQGNLRGSAAADYLKGRGLTGETAKEWRLGYSPDAWDGLLVAARAAGIPESTLEAAGLVVPRKQGDGFYDRFRHRVMFPIADVRGRVVAFGARALGDEEPKYLNSPDSGIFRKGQLLFGLDRARDEAMRTRSLAVMEGYMDVIMAHQHGVKTAVAGLGTAFTPDHASLMGRFADRVVLVYDADAAGRSAADRALGILLEADIDARVAVIPEGKDPCDLLVLRGPEPLRAALASAREVFEHLLAGTAARHELGSVGGRTAAADEMIRAVLPVPNGVKRDLMVGRIGGMFGFSEDQIRRRARELAAASAPRTPAAEQEAARAPQGRAAQGQPDKSPGALDNPLGAPAGGSRRERLLLESALAGKGLAARLAAEAPPETFASPSLSRIARAVVETSREGTADPAACAASLGDEVLADEVAALTDAGAGKPAPTLLRQYEDCVRSHGYERRIEEARRRFHDARARGDRQEEDRRLAELQGLQAERKRTPPATER
jgi:DNA primase